jgi:hypothetical protein
MQALAVFTSTHISATTNRSANLAVLKFPEWADIQHCDEAKGEQVPLGVDPMRNFQADRA